MCFQGFNQPAFSVCRMRLAKAMSLAHMRFGENPDPATPAEKVWVCGGVAVCGDGYQASNPRATLPTSQDDLFFLHWRVLWVLFENV